MDPTTFIAHIRQEDQTRQTLAAHLNGVGKLCRGFGAKFDLADAAELIGLLHDLGKYSQQFQNYLLSATGALNPDEDEAYVDAKGLKGKIDHSTSGAQFIWREMAGSDALMQGTAQMLALCVASHHSGLIDCLEISRSQPTRDRFSARMDKADADSHYREAVAQACPEILERARHLLQRDEVRQALANWLTRLQPHSASSTVIHQQIGLLVRSLFSCLIDADRIDSADFERPYHAGQRPQGAYTGWPELIQRLEDHLKQLPNRYPIDELRRDISAHCRAAAGRSPGIRTLTVPTGGGKTLASLRYALHHACVHGLERIIYVIPYTSIIDQNARVVRSILEPDGVAPGSVVLEHHSNLAPETHGWRAKMLCDNWDAPLIYTTMVQLLDTLFGGGTRSARRLHQLARAVLVFDEVQTLPVRCVHLFNNAMNFLADSCGSSILMCTATQPVLAEVDASKGALHLAKDSELMPDTRQLFADLRRVELNDARRPGGWSRADIARLAWQEARDCGSCLVIVNTRESARVVFEHCREAATEAAGVFHLSTRMCPAHRKLSLAKIIEHLQTEGGSPTLCVSTQLIEAGVDVDFASVVRLSAGLDSIAQAAGRCNRHGRRATGRVHIVDPRPEDEKLAFLEDIRIGRDVAQRLLREFADDPRPFGGDRIGPAAMAAYYRYYFFARAAQMSYPLETEKVGAASSLLDLLAQNAAAVLDYQQCHGKSPQIVLRQSFMTATRAFRAIDTPTRGVIVPFGEEGAALIAQLAASHMPEAEYSLLRQAQQYSVNLFPQSLDALCNSGAVQPVSAGSDILILSDLRYYHEDFGLSDKPEAPMEVLCV